MKQLKLFNESNGRKFGGTLNQGKRKVARPLDTRCTLHLVLKAADSNQLLRHKNTVIRELKKYADRFGLKVYGLAVQADHIHANIRVPSRILYYRWIRTVTSHLVRKVPGLKWRVRPYSDIVSWGRQFKAVQGYLRLNALEGNFILNAHLAMERWVAGLPFKDSWLQV